MEQTMELYPGITLRCFQDTRFKQGALSLQFLRPMCREEGALNALLPAVWLRGTEQYPDLRAITLHLDDLYGASVGTLVRRIGDCQTTGLYCGFMEDRFALDSDEIFAPMVDFLRQLLFCPVVEDGGLCREFVEGEKKNLISTIEAEKNDKRAYASGKLLKIMCRNDSFGLPRLGTVEEVAAITPQALYAHHRKLLAESPIAIYYVGSFAPQQVARLLMPLFANISRNYIPGPGQTAFAGLGSFREEETMEIAQSLLCLGFSTPITNRCPEFAAMQVLNMVLGGGMTSKLFTHVREKRSLCYFIGSGYYGAKGIVTVNAGIDAQKKDEALEEILAQVEACRQGEITPQELTAAKKAVLNTLQEIHDSPGAIESYYSTAAISGMGMTPEQYAQAVKAVTLPQVVQAAKVLRLHTQYFLRGVSQ